MCTHMWKYINICMYIYTFVNIHTYICTYSYVCSYIQVYTYFSLDRSNASCGYIFDRPYVHLYMFILYMYAVATCTYCVCMYAFWLKVKLVPCFLFAMFKDSRSSFVCGNEFILFTCTLIHTLTLTHWSTHMQHAHMCICMYVR